MRPRWRYNRLFGHDRNRCSLRSRRPPRAMQRARVQSFVFELASCGGQMFFGLAHAAAARQRGQQLLVNARIERRHLQPLLQVSQRLFVRRTRNELFEQRRSASAQTAPLSGEPGVEQRAAIDVEPFEKVTGEQLG